MTILHRKILIGNGRILMLDNMKRTFHAQNYIKIMIFINFISKICYNEVN